MTLALFTTLSLLFAPPASAANAVHEACKRLCDDGAECVRKCVAQAELFELKAEFISAVTDWTKKPDDRMTALRSGADLNILELCQSTGWSLDNKMICLRSYPTPEVMKNCKRLSPRQEDQVRCMRAGKSETEIEECIQLVPGADRRLECLERQINAADTESCRRRGGDTHEKMRCLERREIAHDGLKRHDEPGERRVPASLPTREDE